MRPAEMLIFFVEAIHDVGGPSASRLDAQNFETREAIEESIRHHRHRGWHHLREAADRAKLADLIKIAENSGTPVEAHDDVQANRDARVLAFMPNRIEVAVREALAVDIFRGEENALEAELDASAKLDQGRVGILQRKVRNRYDAAPVVRREIVNPIVVGPRVC